MSSRSNTYSGFVFEPYKTEDQSSFDKSFEIFKELITFTSGDFDETINWMKELDKEYKLTNEDYTIDDFVEDLKKKDISNKKLILQEQQKLHFPPKQNRHLEKRH